MKSILLPHHQGRLKKVDNPNNKKLYFRKSDLIDYITGKSEIKSETIEEAKTKLTAYLYNDIFNHWYSTKWSFEGHSEIPKQGTIACGYFVSTTLRDVGFNLNRYKLAQKSPEEEAKVIACGTSIEKRENISKQELKKYFLKQKDGIYFIGLDFHVGYIYKNNQEVYFVHSNYIENKGVMKETIEKYAKRYDMKNISLML